MFRRKKYVDVLLEAIEKEKLILLIGARQVGKTTILKQIQSEVQLPTRYHNCEEDFGQPFQDLETCKRWFMITKGVDLGEEGLILLDEVQAWNDAELILKVLYDDPMVRATFVVTGSRFGGQTKVGSTLVGRGKTIRVHTFDLMEFLEYHGKKVDSLKGSSKEWFGGLIEEFVTLGGYPAVVTSATRDEQYDHLTRIIKTRLQKDVSVAFSQSIYQGYERLFQHILLNVGNTYKVEPLTSYFGVSKKSVATMVAFMQQCFLIHTLAPWFMDKNKEYNKAPKLYPHDMGLMRYFQGHARVDMHDGKGTETYVISELLKQGMDCSFYHKRSGSEIDVIIKKKSGLLIPLEIKSRDKLTIPKIFFTFDKQYGDRVDYYVVTTQNMWGERECGGKVVKFVPYWAVGALR